MPKLLCKGENKMICESCAYYIDNWFYGYQVYCTLPTEYWINPLGWVLIISTLLIGCFILGWRMMRIKK